MPGRKVKMKAQQRPAVVIPVFRLLWLQPGRVCFLGVASLAEPLSALPGSLHLQLHLQSLPTASCVLQLWCVGGAQSP